MSRKFTPEEREQFAARFELARANGQKFAHYVDGYECVGYQYNGAIYVEYIGPTRSPLPTDAKPE